MKKLKYILTGTGRCGTVYYARLLDSLGVRCSHEGVFAPDNLDGVLDRLNGRTAIITSSRSREYDAYWSTDDIVAESSYMAAPFLNRPEFKDTKVIHLLRHPIKVISSYFYDLQYYKYPRGTPHAYMDYVYQFIPELEDDTLDNILRITRFYLEWNKMIVKNCKDKIEKGDYLLHKVEEGCEPVLKWLGLKPTSNMFQDEKANTMKHRIDLFSISHFQPHPLRDELVAFADKHGYDLTPKQYVPKLFL